jgi:prepilin-type N-terminal cleavage/methylation domain-containing protein
VSLCLENHQHDQEEIHMSARRAFTLIEALVVISIIALLVGILLPAIGAARRTSSCMQKSTQLHGIHSGLVLFSQGNNTYFPGYDKDGNRMEDYSTEFRFQELLDDSYFTGEYIISPSENKTAWEEGKLTADMYSYAFLNISDLANPRIMEWRDSGNDSAVVVTDRAIANGDNGSIKSVHTNPTSGKNEWRGSVGFNDNHVTFEASHDNLTTTYGTGEAQQTFKNDNLFDAIGGSLVYSGNDLIIDTSASK